jgi:HemY protein
MKTAFWFLALFAIAVASSLFMGTQQGLVTLFFAPYRVDVSLNLALFLWLASVAVIYALFRAFGVLIEMPSMAKRWRAQQRERALHRGVIDSLSLLMAGRFLRSQKAASKALAILRNMVHTHSFDAVATSDLHHIESLLHLIAAESAHALRDHVARQSHLDRATQSGLQLKNSGQAVLQEASQLMATRWSLADHDPQAALEWLNQMGPGVARRTLALRLKLKAQRLMGDNVRALETARLLSKHGAFSKQVAKSLMRGLMLACLNEAQDVERLRSLWTSFESQERLGVELSVHASQKLLALGGQAQMALDWVTPVWKQYALKPMSLTTEEAQTLVALIENALFALPPDLTWLTWVDQALNANPQVAELQYLCGQLCLHHSLWGKAQQLLERSTLRLKSNVLKARAWCTLAKLSEQRSESQKAGEYWRKAALLSQ